MLMIWKPAVCEDNHKESWQWPHRVDTWNRATANQEAGWLKGEGTTTQMRVDGDGQSETDVRSNWLICGSLSNLTPRPWFNLSYRCLSGVLWPVSRFWPLTPDISKPFPSSQLPLPGYYFLFWGPFSVHPRDGCVSVKIPGDPCRLGPAACLAPSTVFNLIAVPLSSSLSCLL